MIPASASFLMDLQTAFCEIHKTADSSFGLVGLGFDMRYNSTLKALLDSDLSPIKRFASSRFIWIIIRLL
jgi:hypothetical protein